MQILQPFSLRVLSWLERAKAQELDPWLRDDLHIAYLTVLYAGRGDAVACAPNVLATYEVLGVHPDKVWPRIFARKLALGLLDQEVAPPPKKPAQSVKLWPEKTNAVRISGSYGGGSLLRDNTISVPMAAPSIAALYPNSDAPSSAKTRHFTYEQWLDIVRHSYVRDSVRRATLNALTARGPWPGEDGPANGTICVSFNGMALGDRFGDGHCHRRTAQRRAKIACDEKFWTRLHSYNRWLDCPKCSAPRKVGKCDKCGHQGRSRNRDGSTNTKEFCRPYTYEIHLEKFLTAPPPKYIREFCARTWKEHQAAAKRGEHPNLLEMRKPAQPAPPQNDPPPTKAEPQPERAQPAAISDERKALPMTRDTRMAIAGCYANARKHGKSEEVAIAEVCESLSSERYYLAPSEVKLQLKIWQSKNGALDPPAKQQWVEPARCSSCQAVLVQNRGPGPRLICPKCSAKSS